MRTGRIAASRCRRAGLPSGGASPTPRCQVRRTSWSREPSRDSTIPPTWCARGPWWCCAVTVLPVKTKERPMPEKDLLSRYNCGPVKLAGDDNALYERHLTFDQIVPVSRATPRDRFEAVARSVRDVLSQRWLKTEETYRERNVKRVYYLSLEFLMGRSLSNNITNLMLDPVWSQLCASHDLDPLEIAEQEPDAGLGNGGLGRL